MHSRLIDPNSPKTFAIIFDTGDEAISGLEKFATQEKLAASHFTAIGAFQRLTLGYFEIERKQYKKIPMNEQVEVVSMIGDITLNAGKPKIHAHVVVSKSDGSAFGGHLLEGYVRPTLEVIMTESPAHLERQMDESSGLALIRFSPA